MNPDPSTVPADSAGLTTQEANNLRKQYGENTVAADKPHPLQDLLAKFWAPIPWMLEAAIALELVLGKPFEGAVIGALLVFNAVLSLYQESRAEQAVAMLRERLTIQVRVLRDGLWQTQPASTLVPRDRLHLGLGNIVAADVRLTDGNVLIDQSAVTGESQPVEASSGTDVFMGSTIKRGTATGIVTATGSRSSYGKTAEIVQSAGSKGHLQETIFAIVKYLIVVDLALVVLLFIYALFTRLPLTDVLPFCLVLVVASVPVALPAMFTLSAALGTQELAKRGVLVSRLAAIEEAAAMDVLATDKTGTLTKNELSLSAVLPLPPHTEEELLQFALLASDDATQDPIDLAILTAAHNRKLNIDGFERLSLTPFDPASKRSEATVRRGAEVLYVVKGAPAAIASLGSEEHPTWLAEADILAAKGYRVLAVAASPERTPVPIGLVALLDAPREDAGALVKSLRELGIRVIMITGDGPATAATVATQVGITGLICSPERMRSDLNAAALECDVFAGVFPDDKIHLVEALQKEGHVLGMTGDGVNDAPALKQAEVGIAVASATDVAKAAASAVLTNPGLGDVVAAVETSRRIYQRMLTYTLNKIVKTLEISLFLTFGVLITRSLIITPLLMILLMFANDFVTMSIATDHVSFSSRPERWNVRSLIATAIPLAGLSLLMSLGILLAGKVYFHLSHEQVQTLVFVTLVFNGQGMIYLVRERSHLWNSRPSLWLLLSSAVAIVVVGIVSTRGMLMASLTPYCVSGVLIVIVLFLFALDFLKIRIFKHFGMHVTAPRVSQSEAPSAP